MANLFRAAPFSAGAGASDGVWAIEEGGKAVVEGTGEDKEGGGDGGESTVAGDGALAGGDTGDLTVGEGADTGGLTVGEGADTEGAGVAALGGVAPGDLVGGDTGDDAGDCATEEPTNTAISIKNAKLERAIAISFLLQRSRYTNRTERKEE